MTTPEERKMSDELKACPFCGSENHPIHKEGCFIINARYSTIEAYNTRPIEDALRAEIERLKADIKALKERADWAVNHIKQADESVLAILGDDIEDDESVAE